MILIIILVLIAPRREIRWRLKSLPMELHRATRVPTLAQLISQINPENRYAEISTTTEVGKEVVEW